MENEVIQNYACYRNNQCRDLPSLQDTYVNVDPDCLFCRDKKINDGKLFDTVEPPVSDHPNAEPGRLRELRPYWVKLLPH